MKISLKPISENHNEVNLSNGAQLLFSYSTLVAVKTRSGHPYQTSKKYSATTTKHINGSGYKDAQKVSQEELEKIADGLVSL